jgi:hypothetical protein
VAEDQFSSLLREEPLVLPDRLRLVLVDGSFLDVRYPVYSINRHFFVITASAGRPYRAYL